jgi:DDE superfamily endonuclease
VDLIVGWPGSVSDIRVWRTSALNHSLETRLNTLPSSPISTLIEGQTQTEYVPAFILGDNAYPNTSRIVPTYRVTEVNHCPITKKLNRKLASVRYCVENAFGICKGRFRLLNRKMECATEDIERAVVLITAIFTLHNFLIEVKDKSEIVRVQRSDNETFHNYDELDNELTEGVNDMKTRDILYRHIAWCQMDSELD